jgi:hypothetical protein
MGTCHSGTPNGFTISELMDINSLNGWKSLSKFQHKGGLYYPNCPRSTFRESPLKPGFEFSGTLN